MKPELETAMLAEGQRRIISLLQELREQGRPKTTAEMVAELKQTCTTDEWAKIEAARISAASLQECVETIAELRGITPQEVLFGKQIIIKPVSRADQMADQPGVEQRHG